MHISIGGEIYVYIVENPLYTERVIVDNREEIDAEDLPHIFKRFYKEKHVSSNRVVNQ